MSAIAFQSKRARRRNRGRLRELKNELQVLAVIKTMNRMFDEIAEKVSVTYSIDHLNLSPESMEELRRWREAESRAMYDATADIRALLGK